MLRLAFPARAVQNIYTSTLARSSTSFTVKRSKYTLPDLPYDYNALEPIISADIMKVHHEKHHQAYVNGLNVAEEKFDQALKDKDVISQIALQPALKFNGGGHINHSLFWANLAPKKEGGGEPPNGELLSAIKKEFDTLENFISKFNTLTAAVQGSGWGWLGYNKTTKRVEIVTLPNQDPLTTHVPLLGIDVWEHAYYLQYKNARPDYLKAVWEVVNWKTVAARFENAK
ncbi:mitochondrial Mn-superoxide dismutase [Rhizophagus irregularis]|uniref:Superoxide dismutase n=1 Tax=Rhizophagus irregularis TaxID=588596 RepID=A0A2N1P0E9_9GLOM|nr:mitochondrial Mn-superoxide dismutase [Rhizophagus irregularis]